MKCLKCKEELFKISIEDCEGCVENGAYCEDDGYIYDDSLIESKKLERTQSDEEGECHMGSCWNGGCYLFTCNNCGTRRNLALIHE